MNTETLIKWATFLINISSIIKNLKKKIIKYNSGIKKGK